MQSFLECPFTWEGAFRLASMLTDNPLSEPVSCRILASLSENADGSFSGSIEEQIAAARAALALFEYNTDRDILKRIGSWCRYLEIEWDRLFSSGRTLFDPADLMELLVRFYQTGGIKPVLRLCVKLRSSCFDWTTALQTIKQIIALESMDEDQISFVDRISVDGIDYDQKQVLMNHAEMLADAVRYSVFAGIFSGNRQDLTAGKSAWNYLQKHFRAICGGTTSGPFLQGASSDAGIDTAALAAWTEAFAAQMLLPGSEWAVDELIRIAFNGLSFCLSQDSLPKEQYVNCIRPAQRISGNAAIYGRISRAAASVYRNALTITESGIRINYLPDARYILMIQKQPVVLHSDGVKAVFTMKDDIRTPVDIFRSVNETASITAVINDKTLVLSSEKEDRKSGFYIHTDRQWNSQDSICFSQKELIAQESTHHQGLCWFVRNRLMAFECNEENYQNAVSEKPVISDNRVKVRLYRIDCWHSHHDQPGDIPVLPGRFDKEMTAELVPYENTEMRISMFPRISPLCSK